MPMKLRNIVLSLYCLIAFNDACTAQDCNTEEQPNIATEAYNSCNTKLANKLRFGCYKIYLFPSQDMTQESCPITDVPLFQDIITAAMSQKSDKSFGMTVDFSPSLNGVSATFSDGTPLGQGPLMCDYGFLTFGPAMETKGSCSFTTTRLTAAQLVKDDVFSFATIESHDHFLGDCGARTQPCTLEYTFWIDKP